MLHFACPSCGAAASAPKDCVGRTTSLPRLWQMTNGAATSSADPASHAADRCTRQDIPRQSNLPRTCPRPMKPASDAPKTSNRTQAKPSSRPPRNVGPARLVAKAAGRDAAQAKPASGSMAAVFMGLLLFVLAAGGLFGFGVYRYLDSQRPKDDNREIARACWTLEAILKSPPPVVTPGDGVDAATQVPTKADPLPTPKAEPRPEVIRPPAREADAAPAGGRTAAPQERSAGRPARQARFARPEARSSTDSQAAGQSRSQAVRLSQDRRAAPEAGEERAEDRRTVEADPGRPQRQEGGRASAGGSEDIGKLGDDGRPATDAVCQIVASDPLPAVRWRSTVWTKSIPICPARS